MIVDGGDELIGPVAEAIAYQQIAALPARLLLLRPEAFVEEAFGARIDPDAPSHGAGQADLFFAAGVGIAPLSGSRLPAPGPRFNLAARAGAAVDHLAIDQRLQRPSIDRIALAL